MDEAVLQCARLGGLICKIALFIRPNKLPPTMVSPSRKSTSPAKRKPAVIDSNAEERALKVFNRLIAKAAPRATRETAAALNRFHRGIAAEIRRR